MKRSELNFAQKIWMEFLWLNMRLFAMMPYWFKYYVIENVLIFVLHYCLRYRIGVVNTNLRNSFPEKSEKELARIRRGFYRTLSEIFIDTLNMAHMTQRKLHRVISIKGLGEQRARVEGHDWIAMMAHFGCWEYGSYWGLFNPSQVLVAVYHPLRNRVVECIYQRLRAHENAMTITMKESLRFYLQHRENGVDGKNIVLALIADQNPPKRPDSHWFWFLNQDSIFFDGGEKLARRCHLPVYFVKMDRLGRGKYQISFEQIYDGKEQLPENEITERYVRHLEEMIRACPELWMWSHRRWKYVRTDAER